MWTNSVDPAAAGGMFGMLREASATTGTDFSFLLSTAMRESGMNPDARSHASSASGLFQFVEQTWFGLVKQFGARHGLGSFANAISEHGSGYGVADAHDRHAILALRNDPRIASLMEGEYANATRCAMEGELGRPLNQGELYAGHFLGPHAACRLIQLAASSPDVSAASAFPQAAAANRRVFFHADGAPKTLRDVYDWAVRSPKTNEHERPGIQPAVKAPSSQDVLPSTAEWTLLQLWSALQLPSPEASENPFGASQAPDTANPYRDPTSALLR
jgi:hypothetical protein